MVTLMADQIQDKISKLLDDKTMGDEFSRVAPGFRYRAVQEGRRGHFEKRPAFWYRAVQEGRRGHFQKRRKIGDDSFSDIFEFLAEKIEGQVLLSDGGPEPHEAPCRQDIDCDLTTLVLGSPGTHSTMFSRQRAVPFFVEDINMRRG